MTPPTGYVYAERIQGVVKIPDRTVNGVYLPGGIVGPGNVAILLEGEADASDDWKVVPAPTPATPPTPKKGDD